MPSPFPGMDPYLEALDIWPDLHDALASEIRGQLNGTLPDPYYARLEMRPEVGIAVACEEARRIVPDVAVIRSPHSAAGTAGAALLDAPRVEVSPSHEVSVASEPIRHHFVEIRDSSQGHKLVTLIEIVSPSNKRPGIDRRAYERKQREILESDASLVELDLLRTGERMLPSGNLQQYVAHIQPVPDYLVLVNRAWHRVGDEMAYQAFAWTVRETMPCISIPLRQHDPEVVLDLQYIFQQAYDRGPYRRGAVDYTDPPDPPLEDDRAWAEELLQRCSLA